MSVAKRSSLVLRFLLLVVLMAARVSAQTLAPGVYRGQTNQGESITINVGQNQVTSWSGGFNCGGPHFTTSVTVPANSCPILSTGNFLCGDSLPACGMSELEGVILGSNMLTGILTAVSSDCQCVEAVEYTAALSSAPGSHCTAGANNLCLGSSRFKVEATWTSATGSGTAEAVSLSDGTGYLWFFTPDEVEVVVKLVDGCSLNQRFWVFLAGLTNVQVNLKVTDTKTNAVKTYNNKQGTLFAPIADTTAFASCP